MTSTTTPSERAAEPPPGSAELAVRVVGGVLAVWLAVLTAVLEAFFVPLRLGGVRVPVALVLAVAANLVLPGFAYWATRSRLVTVLPALAWFVVILVLAGGRPEGDVVLAGNDWVALLLLLLGSAAAAAGGYFALLGGIPVSLRRIYRIAGRRRRTVPL